MFSTSVASIASGLVSGEGRAKLSRDVYYEGLRVRMGVRFVPEADIILNSEARHSVSINVD